MKKSKFGKFHIALIILFVISAVGLKVWQYHWPSAVVGLKGQELNVLVAKTRYQHYKGLGGRENLGEYDGMLFLYGYNTKIGIVMRNMQFPIDIVWLENGKVIDIAPNVSTEDVPESELKRYYPRKEVNLVLELPAGWVDQHDLKIGDMLTLVKE